MAKEHKTVKEMWKKYLSTIGENINDTGKTYESWYFCNNEKDANELSTLVKKGIKKATASLHYLYEIENEPIPEVGDYVRSNRDRHPFFDQEKESYLTIHRGTSHFLK